MIKRVLIFAVFAVVLGVLCFFVNNFFVLKSEGSLSFSLFSIYIFNFIASLVIYIVVETVVKYLPNETGYLYLGLMLIKFGVFIMIYQDAIFSEDSLTKLDKISILLPVFIFLIIETIGVSKLLSSK